VKTIRLPENCVFINFDTSVGRLINTSADSDETIFDMDIGRLIAIAEYPDESMLDARMKHDLLIGQYLLDAVREGRLRVRDRQTRCPLKPAAPGVDVLSSLVSVNDLREFVADLGYDVKFACEPSTESPEAWLDALAVEGSQPALTREQKTEIIKLYNKGRGTSVSELARRFGPSRRTIDRVLVKAGVKHGAPRK
jgi:hypothetical protein